MVDGLERSDAQRIAALEARVAELERGNPTCVCGAYTPKPRREEFPLPWRKELRFEQMWAIVAADGRTICAGMSQNSADRILSLASRLEAAEKVVEAARNVGKVWDKSVWHFRCGECVRCKLDSAIASYDKSLAGEGGG